MVRDVNQIKTAFWNLIYYREIHQKAEQEGEVQEAENVSKIHIVHRDPHIDPTPPPTD